MNTWVRRSFCALLVLFSASVLTGCGVLFASKTSGKIEAPSSTPDPAPTINVTGPVITSGTSATSFVYTVTYTDATTINLTNGDVTVGGTDSTGCNAVVTNGTTATATVTVTGCTGDGTMNISLAANTAQDVDGNQAAAYGPSSVGHIRNSFIVSFKTNNTDGSSTGATVVSFPLVDWVGYDFDILWGDGTASENIDNGGGGSGLTVSHTYSTPGTYEVKMTGANLPWVQFCSGTDKLKLIEVKQWGPNPWWKMEAMFAYCTNVQITAADAPDLSNPAWHSSGFKSLFQNATNFNSEIGHWDTSLVKDMSNMFSNTAFNKPINTWDTSAVTNMTSMFADAVNFNQSLSSWDTSSVTDMSNMFLGAHAFNQPLVHTVSAWDTSAVTTMYGMFEDADAFNQNISSWSFGPGLTSMAQMFLNVDSFNQNLSGWVLPAGVDDTFFDSGAAAWTNPAHKPTFP
jgi:bacterial surface protein 26-residue repeat